MKIYALLIFTFYCTAMSKTTAQNYNIDLTTVNTEVIPDQFNMGNAGPAGEEIKVNNRYITLGEKPIIPVMGEFHFSRYPQNLWKDVLLKMKANGITVVATYVIWIHHEEIEGQFEWSGDRDLRHFVKLCQDLDLKVYPRIGPWCHGEIRNGGFPDWLLKKQYVQARKNNTVYFSYVDKWFREIGTQLQGLMYKDGGPIIGIQLENEYRRGTGGESHILWLKDKVKEVGLDVPLYTVTGWGNASVPAGEVVPLFGGYPSAPWTTHTKKLGPYSHFFYEPVKTSTSIGNDADQGEANAKQAIVYPNFTCEVGVGNQISYHRRPTINAIDGAAIIQGKIGSGSNLPGYYVFAGGLNPVGVYTTMEENRDQTSYYNEYPDISYDFQAAIGEFGQLAPSYQEVKKIHYWINDFQESIAPMASVFPESNTEEDALQYAVRSNGTSGYVFASNYQRLYPREKRKNIQFNLQLQDEVLTFPSKAIDVPDSTFFIWPFNLNLGDVTLKYASAQLLCKVEKDKAKTWFFFENKPIDAEFLLDGKNIKSVVAADGKVSRQKNNFIVSHLKPGKNCQIKCVTNDGMEHTLVLLSAKEAQQSWKLNIKGQEHLFISEANMYVDEDKACAFSTQNKIDVYAFPTLNGIAKNDKESLFQHIVLQQDEVQLEAQVQKVDPLKSAKWLQVKPYKLSSKQQLHHKQFLKEIHLLNPSRIKSAKLVSVSGSPFKVNINDRWVNHSFKTKKIETVDITGYMKKGANLVFVDFVLGETEGSFKGYIEVEYFNTDKIRIATDESWVENSGYLIPSALAMASKTKAPTIKDEAEFEYTPLETTDWEIQLPLDINPTLSNILLEIDYAGNIAQLRMGHKLLADDYYYGKAWTIGLKNFNTSLEGKKLSLQIDPLLKGDDIYFDQEIQFENDSLLQLNGIKIIPEYQFTLP